MDKEIKFNSLEELAYFTADSVIHSEFKQNKSFPLDWGYSLTEKQIKHIPQKDLRDQVLNDIPHFNRMVCNSIHKKLEWFVAEGFSVEEDTCYRFLSDQEMQAELDNILAE